MRITGWHIDGFGWFHDHTVADLPDGLVVVQGPNEAGKSTLADFCKGVLFGFPDRRSNKPRHPPLRGGALGGYLDLVDGAGHPLRVTRGKARSSLRVTDPSGTDLVDGTLDDALGHASAELFSKVFAVDVRELTRLEALSVDEIRDRVFSAGVLGAGRSARAALATIAAERDHLLKPGGRGGSYRLNQLRDELNEVETALVDARAGARDLAKLATRDAELAAQLEQMQASLTQLREERHLLAQVWELWPTFQAAAEARRCSVQVGPAPDLPEGYRPRLDAAVRAVKRARTERDEAERRRRERAGDIVTVDTVALEAAEETRRLAEEVPFERQRRTDVARLCEERDRHLHVRDELLAQLGEGLGPSWLEHHAGSVADASALRTQAAAVVGARSDAAGATLRAHQAAEATAALRAEIEREEERLAGDPHLDPDVQHQRQHDLLQLRGLLRPGPTGTGPAAPALLTVLVALAAVGVVVGIIGAVFHTTAASLIGLIVALVGLAAVALAVRARFGAPRAAADVDQLAERLGFPNRPSAAEVDLAETEAARAAGAADTAREALRQLHGRIATAAQHEKRAAEELTAAGDAQRRAEEAWRAWLTGHEVPDGLDPTSAEDFLRLRREALLAQQDAAQVEDRLHRLGHESATFATAAQELARRLDLPPDDDPVDLAIAAAAASVEAAQASARAHEAEVRLADATEAHQRAQESCEAAEQRLTELLSRAGATTREEAVTAVELAAAQADREATVATFEQELTVRCGTRVDQARELLRTGDPASWKADADELSQRDQELTADRDQIVGTRRELALQRDTLLASTQVPELEQRRAALQTDLLHDVERWSQLCLAEQLLEQTLQRYQRERQPAVLSRAQQHFATITAGRYPSLLLDEHEGGLLAVTTSGQRVDPATLSRGTVDQLYLCMRFALAGAFADASPLPLLLDDVLVNMDPQRAPRAASVVAEVARSHQVFLFTCHPGVVELLRDAEPDLHLLTLPTPP